MVLDLKETVTTQSLWWWPQTPLGKLLINHFANVEGSPGYLVSSRGKSDLFNVLIILYIPFIYIDILAKCLSKVGKCA